MVHSREDLRKELPARGGGDHPDSPLLRKQSPDGGMGRAPLPGKQAQRGGYRHACDQMYRSAESYLAG